MITQNRYIKFSAVVTPPVDSGELSNRFFDTDTWWTKKNGTTISGGVATVVSNGSVGDSSGNWSLASPDALAINTEYRILFRARQTVGTGKLSVTLEYFTGASYEHTISSSWAEYDVTIQAHAVYEKLVFGGTNVGDEFEIDWVSTIKVN